MKSSNKGRKEEMRGWDIDTAFRAETKSGTSKKKKKKVKGYKGRKKRYVYVLQLP
jgi:hypothetical protein